MRLPDELRLSSSYQPFPRQQEFHDSEKTYRLFGGAAGPGKTKALLVEGMLQALAFPGVDTLLLRRTYPELEDSLIKEFRRGVPRKAYRSYNEAKHIVTWHNGSTTRFGHCRNENDVYQYQGAEYVFIGIDELTHFTLKQWQFLTSRNRCPVPGTFPCMAGATNPGNIGHAWVKALWIDKKAPPGFEHPEKYDPNDYAFIRARIEDNPIYANDANYLKTLDALPANLRKAMLEGNWDIFAGQYFDIFERGRHTAPAEELERRAWWPSWISVDWGFHHPSAVYWHTKEIDPEDRAKLKVATYRELVQPGLSPRALGQAILDRTEADERIDNVFLSPDAFATRTAEASIAEQLGDVLAAGGLPRPVAADDDRLSGWQVLYQLLEGDEWIIGENCRRLIDCLPSLVRDEKRPEDIAKVDGDDPGDAARYGLVHLKSQLRAVPREERLRRRLAKSEAVEKVEVCGNCGGEVGKCACDAKAREVLRVKDFTQFAMEAQKAESEERKHTRSFRPGRRRR